jgi:hypothetical protein
MNSGFGEVTSYSADHDAVEEQRKLPPILLKLTLLAFALAGLPPLIETEALLPSYSQVVPPQVNLPPGLPTVIVPLPPLPVTSAGQGVFSAEVVQEPRLEVQLFQVTELISPSTAPEPPSLVVLPLIVDSEQVMVTNPDDITDFVPASNCVLIAVPLP